LQLNIGKETLLFKQNPLKICQVSLWVAYALSFFLLDASQRLYILEQSGSGRFLFWKRIQKAITNKNPDPVILQEAGFFRG